MIEEWLVKKLDKTIAELNEESHKEFREARGDSIGTEYDRPGGFCYKDWDEFVNKFQDGDEIWEFDSGGWGQLAGRRGYAIVRDNKVVTAFCAFLN